ncbi:hypothetical protein Celaphus_00017126 [Cervus elaphus hippelaphus]|uniref:Ig-like domain-containing protein n=1 Tax=Cervus elaphus hippelaphus TaxID=46360 RepID=A0A212CML3_CEREH|nr:hypothetical protein Celaphus_00017126 [Cervus elaphus hippelaphus]
MVSSEKFLTFPGVLRDGLWSASSQVVLPSPRVPQGSKDYLECNVQHPKDGKTIETVAVAPRVSASTPTPTPTTLAPSTTPRSEGSNKVVNTQSSPGEQPHPCTPVCPSLRCHLQAALHDFSVESLSHTLSQEGGALLRDTGRGPGPSWALADATSGPCVALSPS